MTPTYDRIAERMLAVPKQRAAPFAKFDGKKLHVGTKSLHRTALSRQWRTFWRLKSRRIAADHNTIGDM